MIIEALINLVCGLLDWITVGFNIPDLPEEIYSVLSTITDYFNMGLGFIANYMHLPYLLALFGIVVAFAGVVSLYRFVMWVLRKIPMLGIS